MQIHIYLLKRDNNVTFLIKIVFSYKKNFQQKIVYYPFATTLANAKSGIIHKSFSRKKSELYLYRVLRSFTVFNTYMYLLT